MTARPVAFPLLACLLVAGTAASAEPPGGDPLSKLNWLVGGRWVAEIERTGGEPMTVGAAFERGPSGKTVRYVITFDGGGEPVTQYEGLYYWEPKAEEVRLLQTDRQGSVTSSVVTFEGDVMRQRNAVSRADGTVGEQRVEVARKGQDEFAFTASVPDGDGWREAVALTYHRERTPDAGGEQAR